MEKTKEYFDELFLYWRRVLLLNTRIMKLKTKYIFMESFTPWKALWTRKRFNRIIKELDEMKKIWPINMSAHDSKERV